MLYKITYKRQSDRNPEKWTEFSEVLKLNDLYTCLKWLEKNKNNHKVVSIIQV